MSEFTKADKEHLNDLSIELKSERFVALLKEIEKLRKSRLDVLVSTDITTEQGKATYHNIQGQISVLDALLGLPEETQSALGYIQKYIESVFK
jgi:hypothetical protein